MTRQLAVLALIGALAAPAASSAAPIYSYRDADGVWHFTNVPQDRRYRKVGDLEVRRATSTTVSARGTPLRRTTSYDQHIRAAADRYGVARPLLKAVMAVESNFDPAAVSHKGATGLMQLMPATARDMSVDDIFDPEQNIHGGARYLRLLQDRFGGDLEKVLAAYNAGPERVERHGGAIPPIPETKAYVRKVLARYDAYLRTP